MMKPILSAAVLASMLAGTAAFAATETKTGEIKSINAKKQELVLKSGEQFTLPKAFDAKTLKPGEKVTVTYEMKDGKMVASDVKAM